MASLGWAYVVKSYPSKITFQNFHLTYFPILSLQRMWSCLIILVEMTQVQLIYNSSQFTSAIIKPKTIGKIKLSLSPSKSWQFFFFDFWWQTQTKLVVMLLLWLKKINLTYVLIMFSTFLRSSSSVCSGVTIFLLKLTVVVKRFVETWKSID